MADHAQATKQRITEEREALKKVQSEQLARLEKGKPTPTPEECDLACAGVPVTQHEDDGSGPDPNSPPEVQRRQLEAKPAEGAYRTRTQQAGQHREHRE
jgi:hypothetical protein